MGPRLHSHWTALDENATYAVYCHRGQRCSGDEADGRRRLHPSLDLTGGITAWQSFGGAKMMGGS